MDLYALYRDRGDTLALDIAGDDARAQWDAVGGSLALRAQAKATRDAHFQLIAAGMSLEVVRFDDETTEPVYRARDFRAPGCIAALLEGFDQPVWDQGPSAAGGMTSDERSIDADVVRSIAYWLWQMHDDIGELVAAAAYPMPVLEIVVDPDHGSADEEHVADPDRVTEVCRAGAGALGVRFTAAAWAALNAEGNDGERRIMHELLLGLRELARRPSTRAPDDDALHVLLQQQFANPRKKHLISWNARRDVRGIPLGERYRPASEADAQVVRLALGRHLIFEQRAAGGPAGPS